MDYTTADGLLRVERIYRSGGRNFAASSPAETPGFGSHWFGVYPGRLFLGGFRAETIEYLPATGGAMQFLGSWNDGYNYNFETQGISSVKLSFVATPTTDRINYFSASSIPNGTPEIKLAFADGSYILFQRAGPNQAGGGAWAVPVEEGLANGYRRYFDYNTGGTGYDAAAAMPYRIRDVHNRQLQLQWAGDGWTDGPVANKSPHLTSIGLPDGTSLEYSYDGAAATGAGAADRLRSVKRLNALQVVLWGRTYKYDDVRFPYALTGVLDRNDVRIATYSYDQTGLATSTELAGGAEHYDVTHARAGCCNAMRTVTNPLGRVQRYYFYHDYVGSTLDPKRLDRVESEATLNIAADTKIYSYYDQSLLGLTNERGVNNTLDFDAGRRPYNLYEANGRPEFRYTSVAWHPDFDLPTSETRTGLTVSYTYDSKGAPLTRTETDTTTQTIPYSTSGQTRTWTYTWNTNGRLASVNGPKPVASTKDDLTSFVYDANGNLSTETNGLGHVTTFATYDANGRPGTMTDLNGIVTSFAYDPLGRATAITVQHPTNSALNATTSFEYDVEGRVIGVTAPGTDKLVTTYDYAGRVTAISATSGERIVYVRNGMGGVTSETITRADTTVRSTITRTFDELNRMLTLTLGPGRIRSYQYDKGGNVTQVTGARSNATTFAFDGLNRLAGSVASDAGTTSNAYDVRDGRTSHTDTASVQTTFVRNGFGEAIQEVSPDRGTTVYYYDKAGDVTAAIDGRGQRIDYTRDILGRVTKKIAVGRSASETITYTWDASGVGSLLKGRLGRIVDGSGTTQFQYDFLGNILQKRQPIGTTTAATLTYVRDTAGRVIQMTYPSGRSVNYTRDSKGRVTMVRTKAAGTVSTWTTLASAVTYEAFGSLKSLTYGNNATLLQDWGSDARLYSKTYKKPGGTNLWAATYAYDNDDNLTGITDLVDPAKSVTFGYDGEDRLTRSDGQFGGVGRYDYLFDKNGNRTGVEARTNATDATPISTTPYTLAAGTNRLTGVGTSPNQRTIAYDGRGNPSSEARPGVSVTTAYDGYARLTGYTRTGDPAQANVYNGLDERVAATSGSVTHRYLYAPDGRLMGDYGASAAQADTWGEYVWLQPEAYEDNAFSEGDGIGGYTLLAVTSGTTAAPVIQYIHPNHLGTPAVTTDTAGNATTPGGYAAIGYPGQTRTLTDLYYNKYRDYDPSTGRYIQADPIGLEGGENPYLYAGGNPQRWVDPEGLDIAVIENGPTAGNPIGHTAVAVSGAGVYSFGNSTSAGSSLANYLKREANRRNTNVFVIKTTKQQDTAVLRYLRKFPSTRLPGDFLSILLGDNCATRSNVALDAAGIPHPIISDDGRGSIIPPSLPGSAGYRALAAGANSIQILRGSIIIPSMLRQFEPK